LHTKEVVEARASLRYDRRVLKALQQLWETAQRFGGGDALSPTLNYECYAAMMRRLYKVVLSSYDAEDAEIEIRKDWLHDARGKDVIDRQLFMDALFELTDTWTAGVCAYECKLLSHARGARRRAFVRDAAARCMAHCACRCKALHCACRCKALHCACRHPTA
jgi:hypothetical protein